MLPEWHSGARAVRWPRNPQAKGLAESRDAFPSGAERSPTNVELAAGSTERSFSTCSSGLLADADGGSELSALDRPSHLRDSGLSGLAVHLEILLR
jgi:hypothetical protein